MPKQKIYYKIDYIDKYGNLQTIEDFEEVEDNGWKIELSNTDTDEFVVDGNKCCLYLTKETLKGLSGGFS